MDIVWKNQLFRFSLCAKFFSTLNRKAGDEGLYKGMTGENFASEFFIEF